MVGEKVGKYHLLKLLAQGGMGEVYLAKQEGLKGFSKTVVVKRILDHLAEDKAFSEMFINEARLAALITHPNVVQVFDLGEEEGALYLAMEYVHGRSLRHVGQELNKRGRLMPPALAARVCQLALLGLSHAHRARGDDGQPLNLVHRDVSPDNILLGYDGSVKVTDFGIAKAATSQGLTQAGLVKGKVPYMPPEQVKAEPLDARTDVYAVGVVLYELLAGRRPFAGHSDANLMHAIIDDPPQTLRSLVPTIDPALERIVLDALEKNPAYRFQSAAEMAAALDGYAQTVRGEMVQSAIHSLLVELFGDEPGGAPPVRIEPVATPVGNTTIRAGDETKARLGVDDSTVRMTSSAPALVSPPERPKTVTTPVAPPQRTEHAPTPAPPRSLVAPVAVTGVALALGVGVLVWLQLNPAPAPVAPPPPVVAAPSPPPVKVVEAPAPPVAPAAEPEPAPAPVAPVAAAEPVAKTGRVQLDVAPWGEVFFGKKSLGITPMPAFTLPSGPQVLVVKNSELKVERKVKVNVPHGGATHLLVNLLEP